MKKKITYKLITIAMIAIVATVASLTIVYYGLFQKQVQNDLRLSAKLLENTQYFTSEDAESTKKDLSDDLSALRVTWIDSDGTVLYDNDVNANLLANHADRPEVKAALKKGEGTSIRRSDTMNRNTYYYALLLDNGTVLRVATDASNIWAVLENSIPLIIAIIILIMIVCVQIAHLLTRQLIRPIENMASSIEDATVDPPYEELMSFTAVIRKQHADILSAAKARQDFTANVSHELKTPLTAINGYTELMMNGMVNEEQEQHFLEEIHKNTDRLLSLINDIIRLSALDRSEKGQGFELIDLYDTVQESMDAHKVSGNSRGVTVEFTGEHCQVRADREMMHELVDNLVQNAIRYNNEGGHVWVSVEAAPQPALIVKDDGIGIPADEQSRIFERFYRVDKSRSKATGGTGLGLAIVKHIIELHDAKLELCSTVGEGTTIKVLM